MTARTDWPAGALGGGQCLVESLQCVSIIGTSGDACPPAQEIGKRVEAERLPDGLRTADEKPGAARLLGRECLFYQTRLTDAGFADQGHDTPVAPQKCVEALP